METENTVSIWVGNFESKSQLDEFLTLIYDDEGEVVPSLFYESYEIDIDDIDDYMIEKEVLNSNYSDLYQMLKGVSYEDVIVNNLKKNCIEDAISLSNSIILIYNYSYTGEVLTTENTKFIGVVEYK
ncbi:immunity 22 family protein [Streptococcus oralis]|uniref:immunity 22 family protein n=1 Tax=Streptococcus oralis TaxID=1303 RepID=UPI0007795BE3|nr:immunity 22 family protein [Streptococcus oralis]